MSELVEDWCERRRRRGLRNTSDERAALVRHVFPAIGHLTPREVRVRQIRRLMEDLQQTHLAPRTVRHIYGILHKFFADLVVEELVEVTPCVLTKDQLPKNRDKDPEWRAKAIFDRDEAELLISSDAIPEDRRLLYTILLLTGTRLGEAVGLRWRDYDERAEPLHRLTVARSYDGPLKTEVPRQVPVHPLLASVLAEWRLRGFSRMMGRAATRDDLLIPSREAAMRTQSHVRNKMLDDLARLGLRSRRVHDTRRTFITLARVDGARKDILEAVTHGPRGNIMDAYTTLPWPTLCEAVECLNLRRVGGEVVQLRLAANAAREHRDQASETGSGSAEADPPLVTNRVTSVESRAVFVRKSWTKHANSVSGNGGGGGNRRRSTRSRNTAMLRAFSLQRPEFARFPPLSLPPADLPIPLQSTLVMETLWRRPSARRSL